MSEFDLIATYFTWDEFGFDTDIESKKIDSSNQQSSRVIKSVGDDAAVLSLAANQQLVTSIDTLVSGVHFPEDTSAHDIAYKALAVNLSDLAAMGAKPEWFTLALTLPSVDHEWLAEFSKGLKQLASEVNIALVGGDTTSGPLAISIQVMGSVETGKALYRSGAKQGDSLYVTGYLGDGALGLLSLQNKIELNQHDAEYCQHRLNCPTARFKESELIKQFASSCIDVSDGLLQDLSHVLTQSNAKKSNTELDNKPSSELGNELGAEIDVSKIPLSNALNSIEVNHALQLALAGGDDYELLFTVPKHKESDFLASNIETQYQFTRIGEITYGSGIVNTDKEPLDYKGFNHFS